jgi:hypothetical protein
MLNRRQYVQLCVHPSTPDHVFDTCMWLEAVGPFPWGKPAIDGINFKDMRLSEILFAEVVVMSQNYTLLLETNLLQKMTLRSYRKCRNCSLWIKPTDALVSNFIGITTLHVSGSLSAHHQEFLAVHRLWYILCSCGEPFATKSRIELQAVPSYSL